MTTIRTLLNVGISANELKRKLGLDRGAPILRLLDMAEIAYVPQRRAGPGGRQVLWLHLPLTTSKDCSMCRKRARIPSGSLLAVCEHCSAPL